MPRVRVALAAWSAVAVLAGLAVADEPASSPKEAATRGLALAQRAARNYPNHRDCFSCHHQTLPMLAMVASREYGLAIDDDLLAAQEEFSLDSFRSHLEPMKQGKGIGGRAMTVGYGLWTFEIADHEPDEVTEAMVAYLLKTQDADGHWASGTRRPPMEESLITSTVLSALGIARYAPADQREPAETAIAKAKAWLARAKRTSQEDRAMWLWGLHRLGAEKASIDEARAAVLAAQRDDGGWSQRDDMASDAYATGQALWVLKDTGFDTSAAPYRRGVAFLLRAQEPDGSWRVETRARPVQVYFDNGDPHGKHQFISTPATCWAVAALAAAGSPPPRTTCPEPRPAR